MNKKQKQILGKGYEPFIYLPQLSTFHTIASENAYFSDEDEQSFDEFIDMGNREPNEEGTGRWKMSPVRNRIALYYFGSQTDDDSVEKYKIFIESYLGLLVDVFHCHDSVSLKEHTLTIGQDVYDFSIFHSKAGKKAKLSKSSNNNAFVDVFSLFDILVNVAVEPYLSVVALFDVKLAEVSDESSSGFVEVMGRACGDRVCCVSLRSCEYVFKSVLCVLMHELLHTIGFDHCNSWQCIMNAVDTENWLFLSPVNLRKLIAFHEIEGMKNRKEFLVLRYEKMLSMMKSWGEDFVTERQWIERKLKIINK